MTNFAGNRLRTMLSAFALVMTACTGPAGEDGQDGVNGKNAVVGTSAEPAVRSAQRTSGELRSSLRLSSPTN